MPRIVGLDIGTRAIRIAVADHRLGGGWTIRQTVERPIRVAGGAPEEQAAEALAVLGTGLRSNPVVVSVPGDEVSIRILTLPFRDPQKVAQVAPYELEGQIPFDLDSVVVDLQPIGEDPGGGTRVLAAAAPIKTIEDLLGRLTQAGIEPAVVDLAPLALYTFATRFLAGVEPKASNTVEPKASNTVEPKASHEDNRIWVLEIGPSRTNVCLVDGGRPSLIRTLRSEVPLLPPGGEGRDEGAVPGLAQALRPLIAELRRTLHAARESGAATRGLYVGGEIGAAPGVGELVASELGVELIPLRHPLPPGASPAFVQALGLALRPGPRAPGSRIDFRRGPFSYRKGEERFRRRWTALAVSALFLVVLAGADGLVRYQSKEGVYRGLKQELRREFTATFPETKTVVNEVEQARVAVRDLERRAAFLGAQGVPALAVLREVTQRIPKDLTVDVSDLVIENRTFRVEGETDSFRSAERIQEELAKSDRFEKVTLGDTRSGSSPGKVRFRLEVELREGI